MFSWDARSLRYRLITNGRFVARHVILRAREAAIRETERRMSHMAQQLVSGVIDLPTWQIEMRGLIKAAHLLIAGVARGGKQRLSPATLGQIGAEIREQYKYLNRFGREIANGEQLLNKRLIARAQMYARAVRGTLHRHERAAHIEAGFDEERNRLAPSEHCTGIGSCVEQTERGWVAIGTLIAVGKRPCRVNCKCDVQYRRSEKTA